MDEVLVPRSTTETNFKKFTDDKRPEKRRIMSADQGDDEWTLVTKKRNKNNRVAKSSIDTTSYEVSIIADECLPKQIALAKLLKMEKITSVTNVKYKSPYKVIMKFERKDDADNLVNSCIFKELGYRCRYTNEVSYTYGVVKYIELDMIESDLQKLFSCESEIVSVKRLKRLNENKEWSDSETVRFCFKSDTLPSYVYGSDSRFRVEPYTFPVSQCTSCWRFGHLTKFCTNKKKICPKCSADHENCETTKYKCANCKGEHTTYDRSCPTFIKEKKIRLIMCQKNCTYKVALVDYLNRNKQVQRPYKSADSDSDTMGVYSRPEPPTSGSHKVGWDVPLPDETTSESDDQISNGVPSNDANIFVFGKKNKNKKKRNKNHDIVHSEKKIPYSEVTKMVKRNKEVDLSHNKKQAQTKSEEKKHDRKEEEFSFPRMVENIKNIFFTQASFQEKIMQILKYLFDEVKNYLKKAIDNGDLIRKIISMFHNA